MRYFNAFFITSTIYVLSTLAFLYLIPFNQIVKPKDEVKKISLNFVEVVKPQIKETKPLVEKQEKKELPKKIEKKKIVKKEIVKTPKKIVKQEPKKVIEKIEPKKESEPIKKVEVSKKSEVKKITPTIVNYEQDFLNKHLFLIKKEIQKQVVYSKRARKMNIQGDVLVEFCLTKDGKVENLKALKGHMLLRKSTLEAINNASVFFPKVQKNITIRVPIEYKLI